MDTNVVADPSLSKRQLKKLKRDQQWEENRDKRKALRKEKTKAKKLRKRTEREAASLQRSAMVDNPTPGAHGGVEESRKRRQQPQPIQLPITLVIDCGLDNLMRDTERTSLGAQITRAYSDNNHAPFKAHLIISSFGGLLKERFDTLLEGHYRSWKGVKCLEEDFVEAASQAEAHMRTPRGGKLAGALAPEASLEPAPAALATLEGVLNGEVVYLTSDSPETLTTLSPYSTYIIGGIVDKNRHKGVCYKRAMDRGIKTARLPIGDYLQMSTRAVLTTNHVVEIMLRWLECGDWGEAFMKVMPKRKGGALKSSGDGEVQDGAGRVESTNSDARMVGSDVEVIDEDLDVPAVDTSQAIKEKLSEQEPIQPNRKLEEKDGIT